MEPKYRTHNETFFCYIAIDFAPNEIFFAILAHYGSNGGILLGIDFALNKTFFCYIGTLWKQKRDWGKL
jgi:hypothetical protein